MKLAQHRGLKAHPSAIISPDAKYFGSGEVWIGENSRIDDGCILTGDVTLGRHIHLAPYCVIYGRSGVSIDDFSGFGAFTAMHSESDDYTGASLFGPTVPDDLRPRVKRQPVTIGKHVLGGTRVTILPGVTLPEGVAIGAHSLVKENCEPWTIIAGTPARAIGARNKARYMALLERLEEEVDYA